MHLLATQKSLQRLWVEDMGCRAAWELRNMPQCLEGLTDMKQLDLEIDARSSTLPVADLVGRAMPLRASINIWWTHKHVTRAVDEEVTGFLCSSLQDWKPNIALQLDTLYLHSASFSTEHFPLLKGVRFPRLQRLLLHECRQTELFLEMLSEPDTHSLTHFMLKGKFSSNHCSAARSRPTRGLEKFLQSFSGLESLDIAFVERHRSWELPCIGSVCHRKDTLRQLKIVSESETNLQIYNIKDIRKLCCTCINLEILVVAIPYATESCLGDGYFRMKKLNGYLVS